MAPRKGRPNRAGFVDNETLKTARARFAFADETDQDQRLREKDDLGFYAGDQWPADVKLSRMGQQPNNGMPAVPSRPTLVIDNVREPVSQVVNEGVGADFGIQIVPAEDFGDLGIVPDETEIKLREGLVRRIQRDSQARDARFWAYDRAVKAGRGWYQVLTRYLPGKTRDQELYVHRIYNQGSVLVDPSHQEPDGADIEWAFVINDMLWEDYLAQFPRNAAGRDNPLAATMSDRQWEILGDEYPKWFKHLEDGKKDATDSDTKTRAVRVVEYWYKEHESRELCFLSNGQDLYRDELPEELPAGVTVVGSKQDDLVTVKWCKIDGAQILEETDWPGPDIPLIKILGEELQPYDNQWRAEGMIRPARDAQKGLNYMISKQVEMVGLTPLTPLIADPEAIADYPEWGEINTRVVPFGRYRTYDDQGRELREPHRPNADPNLLPISQSIALFSAQIEKQTRVPAARLGDIDPVTRSGKALDRLTANSQKSTSNFLQNLIRAIRREGEIINNLLYPVYGARQGRVVRTILGDGKATELMQIGESPESVQIMNRVTAIAKLSEDAKFNLVVNVTRDFDTRRQEEHAVIGEIISSDPGAMMSVFGDLYFATMDSPGHQDMAERAKVMLNPRIQQYLAMKEQGRPPTPREMQLMAENAQLKQIAQQQGQELALQTGKERIKQQGDFQKTQLQEDAETMRARERNETTITVAELNALAKELQDTRALFAEERARLSADATARREADAQRAHEAALTAAGAEHDRDMADAQNQHDASMAAMQSTPPESGNGASA